MLEFYLWISAAIGFAQVLDCLFFLKQKGRVSTMLLIFSLVEWFWGGISIYILTQANTDVPVWLPAMYIVYLCASAIYGVMTAARHRNRQLTEITLRPAEVVTGGIFGLLFAISALSLTL
jgi:hypothetical protein